MRKTVELKASNRTVGIPTADFLRFVDSELRPRMTWSAKLKVQVGFRQQVLKVTVEWDSNNEEYPKVGLGVVRNGD